MMLLKVLTIVFGVLVAGSRAVCVVSPCLSRRMMAGLNNRRVFMLSLGLLMAILGAALFYSARLAMYGPEPNISFAKAFWGYLLGVVATVGGLTILIVPDKFAGMLEFMKARTDSGMRVVMFIGFVAGLAILYLGIWVY